MTIITLIVLSAGLLVYFVLLAAKVFNFLADARRVALDAEPFATVSPLNGHRNRGQWPASALTPTCADKRCEENSLTASDAGRSADHEHLLQGGELPTRHRSPINLVYLACDAPVRPTLNRRAHNLGRWLSISPTFNFPVRDSQLGSSGKGRSSMY